MESRCLDEADSVSFSSPPMLEYVARTFPQHRSKFFLATNVFDDEDLVPPAAQNERERRLVFTGSMDPDRAPFHVAEAVARARDRRSAPNLFLDVYGRADARTASRLRAYDGTRYHGQVPFAVAQKAQAEASALVMVDYELSGDQAMYLPSKLLDYLVAGRPIIAITTPSSYTAHLVEGRLGRCFRRSETDAIDRWFDDFIDGTTKGHEAARAELLEHLSARRNAEALASRLVRTARD
jgi:glycosyltransferase involved in cell wall biosynthesis